MPLDHLRTMTDHSAFRSFSREAFDKERVSLHVESQPFILFYFLSTRTESFEPFDSSVKGGNEVDFRCYCSIIAASA